MAERDGTVTVPLEPRPVVFAARIAWTPFATRAVWLVALVLASCGSGGHSDEEAAPIVASGEARPEGTMVLDLYDVKDLTVPIRSYPGDGPRPTPWDESEATPPEDPVLWFEGDDLADLIRETIDTSVWAGGGVVDFRLGGILIVKAPPETHSRIRRLLEGLRAAAPR
jgi:hypothetical protein